MTRLWRAIRNPAVASLIIAISVFALVAAAREFALLQPAEFWAYDKFLTWRAGASPTDPRIVILEITENDLAKYDFPLPDALLARVLKKIADAGAVAIGLDIYRDLAVPRDGAQVSAGEHPAVPRKP